MAALRLTLAMSGRCSGLTSIAIAIVLGAFSGASFAQTSVRGETYAISRAKGSITIDGNLSDEGWRDALRIEKWYEINPGDNTEPKVRNVGYLTYDDKYFYAAFEFDDPDPSSIRAPLADRDNVPSFTDYG